MSHSTEPTMFCYQCGCELTPDTFHSFDGELYCLSCLEEETICCARCGELIRNDGTSTVCDHCYDYHYTSCCRCGSLVANNDAYYAADDDDSEFPYCYTCYDRYERNNCLHSYSYKPEPIFHGEGFRYFGVELEIDHAGKDKHNAEVLCKLANEQNANIYIKTDSSLDDGLEIVTHPMSLEYHRSTMPWKLVLEQARTLGYQSHTAGTCGLHVHVNRDSFSADVDCQDQCIARVLYLVERFWEELLRFSRRTSSQLKRWANRYGYKEHPGEILDTAKKGYTGRYACVNLTNEHTIEFRIFRGTLKYNTLTATLQLVNEICNVAVSMSNEALSRLGWCDFMERISSEESPELITYLKERRLYINEPIVCEEEV